MSDDPTTKREGAKQPIKDRVSLGCRRVERVGFLSGQRFLFFFFRVAGCVKRQYKQIAVNYII